MKQSNRAIVFLFALVFTLSALQSAHAGVIGSYHYQHMVGTTATPLPLSTRFELWIGPYSDTGAIIGAEYRPSWGPVLRVDLTPADVGKTFTVTSGVAFDIAVESLTNGILDSYSWFGFRTGDGGPENYPWLVETNWQNPDGAGYHINGYYGGTNGIDFEGFVIDSISFRLDDYQERNCAFAIFVNGEPGRLVEVDIKPLSDTNSINPSGWVLVPVAILSDGDFDAKSDVTRKSLTFGKTGEEKSLAFCLPWGIDVDRNGYKDLVCYFWAKKTGFQCGDTEGILKGQTKDEVPMAIEGRDSVRIVPCR